MRNILADTNCKLDTDTTQRVQAAIPRLLGHPDPRVQINGFTLSVIPQRNQQRSQSSTLSLRREESLEAVTALASLATQDSTAQDDQDKLDEAHESPPVSPVSPEPAVQAVCSDSSTSPYRRAA